MHLALSCSERVYGCIRHCPALKEFVDVFDIDMF